MVFLVLLLNNRIDCVVVILHIQHTYPIYAVMVITQIGNLSILQSFERCHPQHGVCWHNSTFVFLGWNDPTFCLEIASFRVRSCSWCWLVVHKTSSELCCRVEWAKHCDTTDRLLPKSKSCLENGMIPLGTELKSRFFTCKLLCDDIWMDDMILTLSLVVDVGIWWFTHGIPGKTQV